MKTMILNIGIAAALLTSIQGRATFLYDDAVIVQKLCPKDVCLNHWNNTTILMCEGPALPLAQKPAGEDYVFDSFIVGSKSCLCPCDFIKFYK
jgi:hypothetical protein